MHCRHDSKASPVRNSSKIKLCGCKIFISFAREKQTRIHFLPCALFFLVLTVFPWYFVGRKWLWPSYMILTIQIFSALPTAKPELKR